MKIIIKEVDWDAKRKFLSSIDLKDIDKILVDDTHIKRVLLKDGEELTFCEDLEITFDEK